MGSESLTFSLFISVPGAPRQVSSSTTVLAPLPVLISLSGPLSFPLIRPQFLSLFLFP